MIQVNSIWKKILKMLINKVLSTAGLVKRLIIMQKLEELKNRDFIPKIQSRELTMMQKLKTFENVVPSTTSLVNKK